MLVKYTQRPPTASHLASLTHFPELTIINIALSFQMTHLYQDTGQGGHSFYCTAQLTVGGSGLTQIVALDFFLNTSVTSHC